MKKTDYEVTAGAIASTPMPESVRAQLIIKLCEVYAKKNPRFQKSRFQFQCLNISTEEK